MLPDTEKIWCTGSLIKVFYVCLILLDQSSKHIFFELRTDHKSLNEFQKEHHSAEWCSLRVVRHTHGLAFDVALTLRASRQKGTGI